VLGRKGVAARSIIEKRGCWLASAIPNVVCIYGRGPCGRQVGLWMELLRGTTLKRALQDRGRSTARGRRDCSTYPRARGRHRAGSSIAT